MNWAKLRSDTEAAHLHDMQKQMICDQAWHMVEQGLQQLAQCGHHWHLEEGSVAHSEFPKTVYKFGQQKREVLCQADLDELGEGWFDSPSEAEEAHGLAIQFAGRGGIRTGTQVALYNPRGVNW